MSLTPKQQAFVEQYLVDLNATAAYKRAGYATTGNGASVEAYKLLRNPKVAEAIAAAQERRAIRTEITQDRVLNEIARVAFGDKRRLMKWGPGGVSLLDSETLTDDDAAQVSEVSETISATGGSMKLKTHDKVKALELLGRHLGMFNDKLEVTKPYEELTDEDIEKRIRELESRAAPRTEH